MADEQYRWLDRETAERLLSGEPLEAVDAAAREQVEQLAETLGALSAPPPLTSDELPGEAAALAAFRKVHAERGAVSAPVGVRGAGAASDAGVVRLDRPGGRERRRWGKPARLGLAAALAVGMVGGVAVAAGTGALPSPFHVDEPEPAASVSVAVSDEPLLSPSPDGSPHGKGSPGGSPGGATPGASEGSRDEAGDGGPADGGGTPPAEEDEDPAATAERAERITSACRDMRDGKELSADRKRVLEGAAGSASRVWTYCEGVLADAGNGSPGGGGQGGSGDNGSGQGGGNGRDDSNGSGEQGKGGAEGGSGAVPGDGRRADGAAALPAESVAPTLMTAPEKTPATSTLETGF
ncbi:hypothetical protein [Streptomyces sp. DH24]|uniref:hypothetical protein n=1 Tax=Streptomyces sp. DH24 TaxID=3040123 RepID=UPI0024435B24|nr:hypothetical protein [Streptomyces sp. DH24]MDG9716239.1 hypothetical protein [Streptomyces sp. DH24]